MEPSSSPSGEGLCYGALFKTLYICRKVVDLHSIFLRFRNEFGTSVTIDVCQDNVVLCVCD